MGIRAWRPNIRGRNTAESYWGVNPDGGTTGAGSRYGNNEATRELNRAPRSQRADSSQWTRPKGGKKGSWSRYTNQQAGPDKVKRWDTFYEREGRRAARGGSQPQSSGISQADIDRFPALAGGSGTQRNYTRNKDGNIGWSDYQRDKKPGESYDDFNARHGGSGNRSRSNADPFAEAAAAEERANTTPQGYYHEKPAPGTDKYRKGWQNRREGKFTTHYSPNTGETHHEPRFEDAGPGKLTREGTGTFFDDEYAVRDKFQDPKAESERKWVDDWYNHPATKERWQRLGRDPKDLKHKLKTGMAAKVNQGGAGDASGKYFPGRHQINIAHGDHGYDALAHEYAHATGIDKDQGGILEGILGRPKSGSDYFARGPEMYGWITDIRKDMGVKPGQKITKEMLQKASQTSNDAKRLLKEFDVNKVTKAMNTVADNSKQQKGDSAFARKSPLKELPIDDETAFAGAQQALYDKLIKEGKSEEDAYNEAIETLGEDWDQYQEGYGHYQGGLDSKDFGISDEEHLQGLDENVGAEYNREWAEQLGTDRAGLASRLREDDAYGAYRSDRFKDDDSGDLKPGARAADLSGAVGAEEEEEVDQTSNWRAQLEEDRGLQEQYDIREGELRRARKIADKRGISLEDAVGVIKDRQGKWRQVGQAALQGLAAGAQGYANAYNAAQGNQQQSSFETGYNNSRNQAQAAQNRRARMEHINTEPTSSNSGQQESTTDTYGNPNIGGSYAEQYQRSVRAANQGSADQYAADVRRANQGSADDYNDQRRLYGIEVKRANGQQLTREEIEILERQHRRDNSPNNRNSPYNRMRRTKRYCYK